MSPAGGWLHLEAVVDFTGMRHRAPTEWPDLFGDPLLASAEVDRLADKAYTLVITGASSRAQRSEPPIQEEPSDPYKKR